MGVSLAQLRREDLRVNQEKIVEHQKRNPFSASWVFMGGGKTVSTCTAYKDLLDEFDARRMLVVAPLRVARSVWSKEVQRWSHLDGLKVVPIVGTADQRWKALKTPADIHTINRENTEWLEAQFIEGRKQFRRWPWDIITIDEVQSFRSQSSKRHKSMRRLRRLCQRMIQLTGTAS